MSITDVHRQAMRFADEALAARHRGEGDRANALFEQAFELERRAALTVPEATEPSRSVLLRSAATLALDCDDWRGAEKLAALGLAGDPPDRIANELRGVLEQAHFRRALQDRDLTLAEQEIELSFVGPMVGPGMVAKSHLVGRLDALEKMTYRTRERLENLPFRERGAPRRDIFTDYQPFVSTAAGDCFALKVRFGQSPQLRGTTGVDVETVLGELVDCLELATDGQTEAVRSRIGVDAYATNFLALNRRLAPDGDDLHRVTLTVSRGRRERAVVITPLLPSLVSAGAGVGGRREAGVVDLRGRLLAADSIESTTIKVVVNEETRGSCLVHVPPGMMADIVKPYWDQVVVVRCSQDRRLSRQLIDIFPAE